jgi:hypothetical protein
MGYTTDFYSSFTLDKPLTDAQIEYLKMFSDTRRMKRNEFKVAAMKAEGRGNTRCFELLEEVGLTVGGDGDFYCGTGYSGQDHDESITEYNYPASSQPGLWCQWVPTDDGTEIEWNGAEKFYHYIEWLEYIIENFLKPWGYKLNGLVEWQGEERGDTGVIQVVDNVVTSHEGKRLKDFNKIPDVAKPVGIATETSDIILDLVKLRNELQSSKKGTAVACKKIDEIIKKYGV